MKEQGFVLQVTSKAGDTDCYAAVYHALKAQCLANALWFGWCETEISLPRRFTQEALKAHWDVVRIFTDRAELRAQRRGDTRLTLLLTEDAAMESLLQNDFAVMSTQFEAEPGCRILAGKKPEKKVRSKSDALIEVAFPRELDYDAGIVDDKEMLVADVQCYYDGVRRLKFVRYCAIQPEEIGNENRKVKPYE